MNKRLGLSVVALFAIGAAFDAAARLRAQDRSSRLARCDRAGPRHPVVQRAGSIRREAGRADQGHNARRARHSLDRDGMLVSLGRREAIC